MGFLSRFRRRSKSRSRAGNSDSLRTDGYHYRDDIPPVPRLGFDYTKRLPRPVLTRIFAFVCPHAVDTSYDTSEESMTEDGCMLCDMRDLAHCALACKHWYLDARALLYAPNLHAIFFLLGLAWLMSTFYFGHATGTPMFESIQFTTASSRCS